MVEPSGIVAGSGVGVGVGAVVGVGVGVGVGVVGVVAVVGVVLPPQATKMTLATITSNRITQNLLVQKVSRNK